MSDALYDLDKTYIRNPVVEFTVFSDSGEHYFQHNYIDFSIEKDRDEEPNTANLTIYNLNETSRKELIILAREQAPIEINVTPYNETELHLVFRGELENVRNRYDRPGHSTEIDCVSQKLQHRFMYLDRNYAAGTPVTEIIDDLTETMGLPVQSAELPTESLIISQTIRGPAYPSFKKLMMDYGYYCFVTDGVVYVTKHNVALNETPRLILNKYLLGPPNETKISDDQDVEMRTILQLSEFGRVKKKKKRRRQRLQESSDYISYEAVDTTIEGLTIPLLLQPDIQPDDLVQFPELEDVKQSQYRVREVRHYGNNYGGDWTTELVTSLSSDT